MRERQSQERGKGMREDYQIDRNRKRERKIKRQREIGGER